MHPSAPRKSPLDTRLVHALAFGNAAMQRKSQARPADKSRSPPEIPRLNRLERLPRGPLDGGSSHRPACSLTRWPRGLRVRGSTGRGR